MDIEKAKEILSNPNEWNKYTTNEVEKACEIGTKSIKALEKLRLNITILSTTENISDKFGTVYGIRDKTATDFKESVLKIINEEFNKLLEEEDGKKE